MKKYLKKRALYKIADSLIEGKLPLCKNMIYTFSGGLEWLEGGGYRISSMLCGKWMKIEEKVYEEETDMMFLKSDIYSRLNREEELNHIQYTDRLN